MEVPQLPNGMGKMSFIHTPSCHVGPLCPYRQSILDAHHHFTRYVFHEQVMDRFLGRLGHRQLRHRILLKRI